MMNDIERADDNDALKLVNVMDENDTLDMDICNSFVQDEYK